MTALMWQILLGWGALVLVVCAVYAVIYYVRGPEFGAPEVAAGEQVDFFAPITETCPEAARGLRVNLSDDEISDRLRELDAMTDWAGPGRYRRSVRRRIGNPYDHETEGL